MVRILHVLGNLNRGGSESFIMTLYRNIDRNKIQFDFVIHTDNPSDFEQEVNNLGGRIFRMPSYTVINHLTYIKAWNNFFEANPNYHVIHGHMRSTAAIYLKIAKRYNLRTIIHSHSTSSGVGAKSIIKNILQMPLKYQENERMACSYDAGKWLFGKDIVNKSKFYLVKNAIEVEKFAYRELIRNSMRIEMGLEGKFVLGNVGSFQSVKNQLFLIDIFYTVKKKVNNAVLLLVGDGEMRVQIEKKIISLGLEGSVIMTGVVENTEDYYQAMDIFVFPSKYEGLGIVLIEAQTSGLKAVVSDVIPEEAIITDLVTKLSLDSGIEEWAKIIIQSRKYERNSRVLDVYSNNYDITRTAKWFEEFYMNLPKGRE